MESQETPKATVAALRCYRVLVVLQLVAGIVVVTVIKDDGWNSLCIGLGAYAVGNAFAKMFPSRGFFLMHGADVPWEKSA